MSVPKKVNSSNDKVEDKIGVGCFCVFILLFILIIFAVYKDDLFGDAFKKILFYLWFGLIPFWISFAYTLGKENVSQITTTAITLSVVFAGIFALISNTYASSKGISVDAVSFFIALSLSSLIGIYGANYLNNKRRRNNFDKYKIK